MNIRHFTQNLLVTSLDTISPHSEKISNLCLEVSRQGFAFTPDDFRIYVDCDGHILGELTIYNPQSVMNDKYVLTIEYLPLNRKKGWKGDKPWKVSGNIRPPHKWYLSDSYQRATLKEALGAMIEAIVKESNPNEN